MKPTNKLRFVERTIKRNIMDGDRVVIKDSIVQVRILQQWWGTDPDCEEDFMTQVNGGWRDVPIEEESK